MARRAACPNGKLHKPYFSTWLSREYARESFSDQKKFLCFSPDLLLLLPFSRVFFSRDTAVVACVFS